MPAKGTKGVKNRNYPALTLQQALAAPRAIQDHASGMPVSRLTLADILGRSPQSSYFRDLLLAAHAYGLTQGGVNADRFALTQLGHEATGADEVAQLEALRKAVLNIDPFRTFLTAYNNRKVPAPVAFKESLIKGASVPPERADDCMKHVLDDAHAASLIRTLPGGDYIELNTASTYAPGKVTAEQGEDDVDEKVPDTRQAFADLAPLATRSDAPNEPAVHAPPTPSMPKKVFIAHGKNRAPLEQLKKTLDQLKVKYAVAIDEPHGGRPISVKVANLMRDECSSAIFIFTADEHFARQSDDGGTTDVWRPSENVIYELGAASILYDRRIVIFKEKRVTLPSDFSDLGYIEFEPDQLGLQTGNLIGELVALDILEIHAKG